jgi:hypothetical protein
MTAVNVTAGPTLPASSAAVHVTTVTPWGKGVVPGTTATGAPPAPTDALQVTSGLASTASATSQAGKAANVAVDWLGAMVPVTGTGPVMLREGGTASVRGEKRGGEV